MKIQLYVLCILLIHDSGFEFKIVNKSMLVGMHSKYNANLPDATSEKRIQICARDLLDAELKFYNPRYGIMQKVFIQ